MEFSDITPGDIITAPFWPLGPVTVEAIHPAGDGYFARVTWTAPDGEGIAWISAGTRVRRLWTFTGHATRDQYRTRPTPVTRASRAIALRQADHFEPYRTYGLVLHEITRTRPIRKGAKR